MNPPLRTYSEPVSRSRLLEFLAARIARLERGHPIRVAIDGVDGAGKTQLAEDMVEPMRRFGRPVIRASIDGFHHPAHIRYQRGRTSPEGYFRDSFDYQALIGSLLAPLGPGGSLRYRKAVFDFRTDSALQTPVSLAESDAVLLFDGVFLLRPELKSHWDFTIFVEAAFDVTLRRAQQRDLALFGSLAEVTARYESRYIPGQQLYLEECRPRELAAVVVENNDPERPRLSEPRRA
jgi:uridine kinase